MYWVILARKSPYLSQVDSTFPFIDCMSGLLTLNEVLSCVPPSVYYPPDTSTSINSLNIGGVWPTRITRWEGFLTEVNQYNFIEQERYETPQFFNDVEVVVETNIYTAMEVNIFSTLNKVMKKYKFAKQKDSDFPNDDPNIGLFVPVYTCRLINNGIHGRQILALEIKRQIVVEGLVQISNEDLEEESFSRRQNLSLQQDPQSSENTQVLRSLSSSYYGSNVSSMFTCNRETRQQPQDKEEITEQDFDVAEFKLKSLLGYGQTGGTYQCEFYGQAIALKALNLYKNSRFFYKLQNEIEIYKRLTKIQGMYIPKLVCYGYYGGGMGYIIGTTIVGTMLRLHKIEQRQKSNALKALKIIHSHNILHNDIREENILVNEK
ncbi:15932_t:CDS:2, partial [Funneliformis geosporum]